MSQEIPKKEVLPPESIPSILVETILMEEIDILDPYKDKEDLEYEYVNEGYIH